MEVRYLTIRLRSCSCPPRRRPGARYSRVQGATPPAESTPSWFSPAARIPLSMINSVNTKNSAAGDRVYLQTVFPIIANGKIVIPPGSYVEGTVTEVKRPGRVKGRGSLFVRFDSLILPNGVTRDFLRARRHARRTRRRETGEERG